MIFACEIALLHGESDPYFRTPLVVATTHQLLKFYQAFDLLIVDEVDAFPYVDNPVLYHAVNNCVKENGLKIFLTATSTDELDRKVKQGDVKASQFATSLSWKSSHCSQANLVIAFLIDI